MPSAINEIPRHRKVQIEAIRNAFAPRLWKKVCSLGCTLCVTNEMLSIQEAQALPFEGISNGERWGDYNQYGWFHASVEDPISDNMAVFPRFGGEGICYQGTYALGSVDRKHDYIFLKENQGKEIYFEIFAGGDTGYENIPVGLVSEPPYNRPVFKGLDLCVLDRSLYADYMDFSMVYSLLQVLEPTSLMAQECAEALFEYSRKVDFDNFDPSLGAGTLRKVLSNTNGSCNPRLYMFGQSHLDLAWLWTLEETKRKVARTYSNTLALMDRYPDYRFLCCEPIILDMLENLHPEVYRRVKDEINKGRFYCEGGFYVECDTNFPSGESIARQLVRGQEAFVEHCGERSSFAWLPDCFGFSAALPQLFKLSGIEYFSTNKLQRQDPEAQDFPFNDYWWEGMDGSRIRANNCFKNNCNTDPENLYRRWHENRLQKDSMDRQIYPFGHGDGGGGATYDMVEMMEREKDVQGLPVVSYAGPVQYFEELPETDNVFSGELYLAWHRGTYTSQERLKSLMRKAENALRAAELESAKKAEYKDYRKQEDVILLNQFHDIISGVAIRAVNDKAVSDLEAVLSSLPEVKREKPSEKCHFNEFDEGFSLFDMGNHVYITIGKDGRIWNYAYKGRNLVGDGGGFGVLRIFKDYNPNYDGWEIPRHYREDGQDCLLRSVKLVDGELLLGYEISDKSSAKVRMSYYPDRGLVFDIDVSWHEREKLLRLEFDHSLVNPVCLAAHQFGYVQRPCDTGYQLSRDRYECSSQGYACLREGDGWFLALLSDRPFGYGSLGKTLGCSLLKSASAPDARAEEGNHCLSFCLKVGSSLAEIQKASNQVSGQKAFEDAAKALIGMDNPRIRISAVRLLEDRSLEIRLYDESGSFQHMFPDCRFLFSKPVETNLNGDFISEIDFEYGLDFHAFEVKTLRFHDFRLLK
jgi:alpha-mannosidase